MNPSKRNKELLINFGKRIKQIRLSKNMSQLDLAAKLDSNQPYISDLEKGINDPSLSMIHFIAICLEVDLKELLQEY